jgi:5'-nucleotidase
MSKLFRISIVFVLALSIFGPETVHANVSLVNHLSVALGTTTISLTRDFNNESMMGDVVTDSMRWKADLEDDGLLNNTVHIALIDPGSLQADITIPEGATIPYTITDDDTYAVLPSDDTLFLMNLTGAQLQTLLDQSSNLYKGILQSSGMSYYWYNDSVDTTPYAWGAYGINISGGPPSINGALVRTRSYRIVTSSSLAAGLDYWTTFPQGTNRTPLSTTTRDAFSAYVLNLGSINESSISASRLTRLDNVVTMLHTNDLHGVFDTTSTAGVTRLASLIESERAHNPNVLLLDAGDTFQGNSFAYFFKDSLNNPIAGAMNLLGYDAMTIGNHEFNFGPTTFATMLGQVNFPLLGTINIGDDGSYGLANLNMQDYTNLEVNGLKVTLFGLTNPLIYTYELPSNIPGLTFYPATEAAQIRVPEIIAQEQPDLLVGLTHVGYSGGDSDSAMASTISGIDVIIGGHSHSSRNPATMQSSGNNPNGTLVAQTGSGASNLGKVNVGFIDGQVVLREGYLIPAREAAPSPVMSAYLAPFVAEIGTYNATVIGSTYVPIDALQAYTQETNGANLQTDAAVWGLAKSGLNIDMHLSGAMSNRRVAASANSDNLTSFTKGDMFTLMPYENSLVVFSMNGPQIKTILERSYRNYFYYKYVPGRGGYSYYTTCMLDINSGGKITYLDAYPEYPNGNNVISLVINGKAVDFNDPDTYYLVSTVNYLAAGACNYTDNEQTIWPIDQIVYDTQYYVRDNVIEYVEAQPDPIAPLIDGRLLFVKPESTPEGCVLGLGWWKNVAAGRGNTVDIISPALPIWLGLSSGYASVSIDTLSQVTLYSNMNNDSSNGINRLYAHLLSAKLNLSQDTNPAPILSTIIAADNFLTWFGPQHWSMLSQAHKDKVSNWAMELETYNEGSSGVTACK